MSFRPCLQRPRNWLLLAALALTAMVYWPGLSGGWLFDDFPNIVENPSVQPTHADLASLTRAALSSPSSQFKRPLASLSFAANYLVNGLDPFGWKLVNLGIHLLNGILIFLLSRQLLRLTRSRRLAGKKATTGPQGDDTTMDSATMVATCLAAAWLLLPINLTGVLYVVQRMESLANVLVLLGLLGYVAGRCRMADYGTTRTATALTLCTASLVLCTGIGVLVKETAIMLPFYALLIEWLVFRQRGAGNARPLPASLDALPADTTAAAKRSADRAIVLLFIVVLVLPLIAGMVWLLPHVLSPDSWATRDFTLPTRLLSEARIVVGYIAWSLLALPHWLSFYHDDFHLSTGLLQPGTTIASIMLLGALIASVFALRRSQPLAALGIALFLGCHLLTATILPLELIYEHRNYFASFGLLLALVPLLVVPATQRFSLLRRGIFGVAMLAWCILTATTAYAWGDTLRLARELAARAPASARAQYELGRSYIIASHYDPSSVYTPLVYAPLERAAKLPASSILPQQALIFFNARMHRPIQASWWRSLIASLKHHQPDVQDESSLAALNHCARKGLCPLSKARMQQAFEAAVSHPDTSARLWASYGDYAWNVIGDHTLGLQLTQRAVASAPNESAYHITLARMLIVRNDLTAAEQQMIALEQLNIGGRLSGNIAALRAQISRTQCDTDSCKNVQHRNLPPSG